MAILQTLKLDAKDSSLTLTACDGEMWAERKILANVPVDGSACVQAKLLSDVISSLPDGTVTMELDGSALLLRQTGSEWRMLALPAAEFPAIPEVNQTSEIRLKMGELRELAGGVSYAVADETSRPILTGVLFTYDGSILTLVATDTHRLAVVRLTREGIGSEVTAVVPERALRSIRNLPLTDAEEVRVRFDESRIGVDSGEARVVSQLLAGSYPNWERVVPSEHTRTWVIDRNELLDNVKRALIMARDNAFRVRFSGHGEQVQISARSEEKGEAKEELVAVTKNGDIDIAFNGRYVIEAISALKGEGIRAEMTEPSRPAVFRPVEGDADRYCVIMPMALG